MMLTRRIVALTMMTLTWEKLPLGIGFLKWVLELAQEFIYSFFFVGIAVEFILSILTFATKDKIVKLI